MNRLLPLKDPFKRNVTNSWYRDPQQKKCSQNYLIFTRGVPNLNPFNSILKMLIINCLSHFKFKLLITFISLQANRTDVVWLCEKVIFSIVLTTKQNIFSQGSSHCRRDNSKSQRTLVNCLKVPERGSDSKNGHRSPPCFSS